MLPEHKMYLQVSSLRTPLRMSQRMRIMSGPSEPFPGSVICSIAAKEHTSASLPKSLLELGYVLGREWY